LASIFTITDDSGGTDGDGDGEGAGAGAGAGAGTGAGGGCAEAGGGLESPPPPQPVRPINSAPIMALRACAQKIFMEFLPDELRRQ
jgi:hypothetical protein